MTDKEPMFPVLNDPIIRALPWAALRPHDRQAQRNHGGQTLNRLSQRGGLGIEEAYCILKDMDYPTGGKFDKEQVRIALMKLIVAPKASDG